MIKKMISFSDKINYEMKDGGRIKMDHRLKLAAWSDFGHACYIRDIFKDQANGEQPDLH